jgi:hypothetical protein
MFTAKMHLTSSSMYPKHALAASISSEPPSIRVRVLLGSLSNLLLFYLTYPLDIFFSQFPYSLSLYFWFFLLLRFVYFLRKTSQIRWEIEAIRQSVKSRVMQVMRPSKCNIRWRKVTSESALDRKRDMAHMRKRLSRPRQSSSSPDW